MIGDIVFEPYACRLQFVADMELDSRKWEYVIELFLKLVASECVESCPCFIGHIKGFVDCSDTEYLKFSLVDTKRSINITGGLITAIQSISVDLNIHIYGIKRNMIDTIIQKNTDCFRLERSDWKIEIDMVPIFNGT